jgi:hypothetical protein
MFLRVLDDITTKVIKLQTKKDPRRILGSYQAVLATCFRAGSLLGLFLNPEDGGDMFLRNVSRLSTDYTALYPRR